MRCLLALGEEERPGAGRSGHGLEPEAPATRLDAGPAKTRDLMRGRDMMRLTLHGIGNPAGSDKVNPVNIRSCFFEGALKANGLRRDVMASRCAAHRRGPGGRISRRTGPVRPTIDPVGTSGLACPTIPPRADKWVGRGRPTLPSEAEAAGHDGGAAADDFAVGVQGAELIVGVADVENPHADFALVAPEAVT